MLLEIGFSSILLHYCKIVNIEEHPYHSIILVKFHINIVTKIYTFIRGRKMWWFSLSLYSYVFSVIDPTFVSSWYLLLQLYLNWYLYLEWEVMFPYVRCQTLWGENVLNFTHIDTDYKNFIFATFWPHVSVSFYEVMFVSK